MNTLSATEVRKNWSLTLDSVIRNRPAYIKRTRDNVALNDVNTLNIILSGYKYQANKLTEPDGSITLSMVDLDIVANDYDEEAAKKRLAAYIKEYAEEFYGEFHLWSSAPNRKPHIPYVVKALSLEVDEIMEDIVCLDGKN